MAQKASLISWLVLIMINLTPFICYFKLQKAQEIVA